MSSPERAEHGRVRLMVRAAREHARLGHLAFAGWLFGSLVGTVMPVGISWAFGLTVGGVPGAVRDGLRSAPGRQLVAGLIAMTVMDLVHAQWNNVSWRCAELLGLRYRAQHRLKIMRTLTEPPGVAHLHDPEVLDAVRAADNEWVKGMLEGIGGVGSARLRGLAAAGLVAAQHVPAAVVLAIAWTIYGRWSYRRAIVDADAVTGQADLLRRSEALHAMGVAAPSAKEVRLFGLGSFFGSRFAAEWGRAMRTVWEKRRTVSRGRWLLAGMLLAAHGLAFAWIARDAAAGLLTVTALATAFQAGLQSSSLGSVPHGHYEVEYGLAAIPNLDRLMGLVEERAERLPGSVAPSPPVREIDFEDVVFSYPRSERRVLDGFTVRLPVGTSLAIVGDNGAGKTTLVQLLARLRDPSGGRITVDGTDLRDLDPPAWQRMVAAVSQVSLQMPLSLADNLRGGRDVPDDVLLDAAHAAGAGALAEHIGLETTLAREFTGGKELSGGQWQRLALTRALAALHAGAEILILDEPTAHMDARAEADLYGRFLDITRGRTTVLISHRFSTVRRADRIVVLEHGRVVEEGTHEELVSLDGRYARSFRVQAARFAETVP